MAVTPRLRCSVSRAVVSAKRCFRWCVVQFRRLGRSGLRVSAVGLGCNPFGNEVDASTARAIVSRAIDLGVNYFDTADSYYDGRSEDYLGQALEGRRHEVVLATKFGNRVGPGPNDTGA